MNSTLRTPLIAASTLAALWCASLSVAAENPNTAAGVLVGTQLLECTAYLRPDYIESIKSTGLLEGNKLEGTFRGFEADFAKFTLKGSKALILIPKSAILYMVGKEKLINF